MREGSYNNIKNQKKKIKKIIAKAYKERFIIDYVEVTCFIQA